MQILGPLTKLKRKEENYDDDGPSSPMESEEKMLFLIVLLYFTDKCCVFIYIWLAQENVYSKISGASEQKHSQKNGIKKFLFNFATHCPFIQNLLSKKDTRFVCTFTGSHGTGCSKALIYQFHFFYFGTPCIYNIGIIRI